MDSFNSAHAFGLSLVDQGHFAAEDIQENCEEMTLVKDELIESWEEKQIELSQSYELQVKHIAFIFPSPTRDSSSLFALFS